MQIVSITEFIIHSRTVKFAQTWIAPVLGEGRPIRRTNRVLPEPRPTTADALSLLDEAISTARTPRTRARPSTQRSGPPVSTDTPAQETRSDTETQPQNGSGMVRQWVTELAGAARPSSTAQGRVRVPSDEEIQLLTGMFPDVARDVVLGVLQRRFVRFFTLTKHPFPSLLARIISGLQVLAEIITLFGAPCQFS